MGGRVPILLSLVGCERMPLNTGRDAAPDSFPLRRMGAKQMPGDDRGKIEQIQVLISQLQVILHFILPPAALLPMRLLHLALHRYFLQVP